MAYKCWAVNDTHGQFTGTLDIAKRLESGLYQLHVNNEGAPVAGKLTVRRDAVLNFTKGPLQSVLKEADTFWKKKAHYEKLGVSHKRSILLHGPHGCGKTGIITSVIADTISRDGLAFQVPTNLHYFSKGFPLLRQLEVNRPVLVVLEDLEQYVDYDEETVLEILDGTSSPGECILFLSTTNKLKKLPPRIRCRPSRVDTLIEVKAPTGAQREEYLQFLLGKDDAGPELAKDWATKTDGLSLASLKELVLAVRVQDKPIEDTLKLLKELAKDKDGE